MVDRGKTLILGRTTRNNPKINSNPLGDDVIYEISWDGKVLWKWQFSDHVDEMGFNDDEFKSMQSQRQPRFTWFWCNCASWLGPNKWYDAGDERFHPDNIIWDSKTTNIMGITDRKTGKIVWQVGPHYDASPQLKKLGWIIGPHKTHMIPKGMPGAGNILVYDNGGDGGYGTGNPISRLRVMRDYSRVVEFDPITLEIVWEYSGKTLGLTRQNWFKVYSNYISGAQRLPNGNTLITEGATGVITEVTRDLETVWEYVSPHLKTPAGGPGGTKPTAPTPKVYRAYRVPYEWVPQLKKPKEEAVIPPGNQNFKVQGTGDSYKGYVKK
ncbi:MAG: aryl-sulfate sulfotransferase [Deltaproteobacteria bacterium]|nr:aryl-sulfate sulfotransferase [Deltaproteobacteria bacterium]